jgi:hypothetical protein
MNTRWFCSRCRSWVPGPDEAQGLRAAQVLAALLQVQARRRVVEVLGDAHAHPADRVHHVDQAAEADPHVVVDLQAGGVLHRLGQQLGAAEGVGGVQLVHAEPGDRHVRVAGQADQHGRPAGRDVQEHDRVRAVAADAPPGGQLAFLLAGQSLAAVRAGDEPVLPVRGGRAPGVVDQHVGPGQLGVQVEVPDPAEHQDDHDDQGDDGQDPARAQPPAAPAGRAPALVAAA